MRLLPATIHFSKGQTLYWSLIYMTSCAWILMLCSTKNDIVILVLCIIQRKRTSIALLQHYSDFASSPWPVYYFNPTLHWPTKDIPDISLFWRELPIFCPFLRKSPYQNFRISFFILYISLFGISGLPTKIWEFTSLFNHSPYLKKKISLFVISNVSHVRQKIWVTLFHSCLPQVYYKHVLLLGPWPQIFVGQCNKRLAIFWLIYPQNVKSGWKCMFEKHHQLCNKPIL